ncbi:MAG TPA: peptidoglycan-binding domain-containing protein [Candidatus Paceibacterota bacterium]|nr:peptidoglycan-binding domain-containing protein [Candidatus Paceibacterota bacterium]
MTITQSSTRLVAFVAGVAVALSLFAGAFAAAPAQAAALTQSQISAIISLLQSFGADAQTVANVTASLNGQATTGTGTGTGTGGACPALSRSLQQGSTGADVKALQVFLNAKAATQVASSGAGSPGLESTYFGPATKAAVIKFQTLNNVDPIGIVGPATRAAIAAVCGGTSSNPGTPSGPGLSVSAAAQPANSLAVESASRVPFTTFTLTNNSSMAVTINSVTVQRVGFANDSVFSGIVLLDQTGAQIGVSSTLNSNHQANIGSSFMLNPGQSMTYTVAGNMASNLDNYSGQIAQLQVVAINSSAAVNGSLPITGASQTINSSLAIGTATLSISSYDPANASTKNIGDTGVNFSGVRVQAGSAEDVRVMSIRWRMNGSVSSSDLANLMTYVNGTSYPVVASTDGRYLTSVFPGGVLVQKGYSADVYLKGDIAGSNASGRVAAFDIDKASDIYVVGQTYGYGIIPTANSWDRSTPSTGTYRSGFVGSGTVSGGTYAAGQPFFQGSTVTIQGGTVTTITNASSVASQNIAINVPNQVLGGFTTNFVGEPVSVQTLTFAVSSTTGSTGFLTNVSIVDKNGSVVAGPVDENTAGNLVFSNTITFPVGSATYTLKGTVPTGAANGSTYRLSTTPSSWTNVTGQTTGNTVSLSSAGTVSMNTMTVRGATLAVSVSATPAAQSIVAGGQNTVFANVQLDASQSGEDIRLNSLPLMMVDSIGSAGASTSTLSGCQLWNGAVGTGSPLNYGSNTVNSPVIAANSWAPAATYPTTFNFNNSLVVPKGTVTTLTLTCNVASGTTGTFTWGVVSGQSITATGNTSNSTVGPTNGTLGMTITSTSAGAQAVSGTGTLTVGYDAATSPSAAIAAGGTNGVTLGVIKFRAANESINLTKVGLKLTSGTAASLGTVYLYNGATQVGTATFTGTYATTSLASSIALPANTDFNLTIKGDLAQIGVGQPGVEGAIIKVDPSGAEGTGVASGQPVSVGATAGVAGVTVYKTFPTVTLDNTTTGGVTGDGQLIKFHVTANSAGSLGVKQFVFSFASSTGIVVANPTLYAYSDSSFSTPAPGTTAGVAVAATYTAGGMYATTTISTPIQVPGGSSVYFLLKGTVTYNGSASNYNINTTLMGDGSQIASPAVGTATALDALYNFVWSPNATGTVTSAAANDYANGYGVVGLPSLGINQNRTQ